MKKTILYIAQSLDGFVANSDGAVKWLDEYFDVDFGDEAYKKFMMNIDTIIQGSVTYDQFKPKYPGKNSYVFTHDADSRNEEGTSFVKGNVKEFINSLDEKNHKNIWLVGGPKLLSQFMNEDLIDEMMIFVMPVFLKKGIPLFSDIKKTTPFSLKTIKSYAKGVAMLHYEISGNTDSD